jgi:hypothetical protein
VRTRRLFAIARRFRRGTGFRPVAADRQDAGPTQSRAPGYCEYLFSTLMLAIVVVGARTIDVRASDYASEVVSYNNSQSGVFNNPQVVLGRPAIDTAGDFNMFEDVVAVLPVFAPWQNTEVYRVGESTSLVVKFDHPVMNDPLNPCGVDLIVFGNAIQRVGAGQYWLNGDPNSTTVQTAELTAEAAAVSVSQDGVTWYTFGGGPFADAFAPTLGRIYDPAHYDPTLESNLWWGMPTIPTYPLNPTLTPTTLAGKTVAEYARKYGWSAGGTSYDLDDLSPPLPWIQYVRVAQQPGSGVTPEIDAFADVEAMSFPDLDCDSDVDQDDLALLQACASGPDIAAAPGCERADFDQDGDADQDDFAIWQRCFSGTDVLMDFSCVGGS